MQTNAETFRVTGTDAGKPDQACGSLWSSVAVVGGHLVNAILSISEKRET